jgi:hypothetical protein
MKRWLHKARVEGSRRNVDRRMDVAQILRGTGKSEHSDSSGFGVLLDTCSFKLPKNHLPNGFVLKRQESKRTTD